MPDLHLKAGERGEIQEGDVEAWEELQRLSFLHQPEATERKSEVKKGKAAKRRASAEARFGVKEKIRPATPKVTQLQRLGAQRHLKTLDYVLKSLLGYGLAASAKSSHEDLPLSKRPVLVLMMDEGSQGCAMVWRATYHLKLRAHVTHDPFRRAWSDVKLALSHTSLWWAVLLTNDAVRVPHGPWAGAALLRNSKMGQQSCWQPRRRRARCSRASIPTYAVTEGKPPWAQRRRSSTSSVPSRRAIV